MFSMCILCCFVTHLIDLAFQLLQYKYCHKTNCTGHTTLHKVRSYILMYFIKCSPHQEMFQMKVVDLKCTFYVPCQFFVLCIIFEKNFSLCFV
jgi:hypothetical protein